MSFPHPVRAALAAIAAFVVGGGVITLAPAALAGAWSAPAAIDTTSSPNPSVTPSTSVPSSPSPTPTPSPTAKPKPSPYTHRVYVSATITPGNRAVVGVAYPITVKFSRPVSRRIAQAGLSVTTSRATSAGAWSWTDSSTAMYRTRTFWPANTTITVTVKLGKKFVGVVNARTKILGGYGTNQTVVFHTSRAQVSYVNDRTHRMSIFVNGSRVKTFGVSLGKSGFLTRSGIKVTTDKYAVRRMTGRELGLRKPSEQYDLQVPWAVRITPTGEFIHAAPWASGRIGRWNGSHGCTNLLPGPGRWFYDHSIPGDPVITVGTHRKMEPWNGLGGPWNVAWSDWLSNSYSTR